MTKAPIPTENSKKQSDQNFDYTTIADRHLDDQFEQRQPTNLRG